MTVRTVSRKIWKAMTERDEACLRASIHEEAVFVHMGATLSRDEEIEAIKTQQIIYKDVAVEETSVKQIGDTTLVLTKLTLTAVVGGNEVVNPFVVTEVYTKIENQFMLISQSYTRILD